MATVEDWLRTIRADVPEHESSVATRYALIEAALHEHPKSYYLWCLRGDYLQLVEDDEIKKHHWTECVSSYLRAAELEPTDPRPYAALGLFFDVIHRSFAASELYYRHAIKLGDGVDNWIGLARVVAQSGRPEDAVALLAAPDCSHADTEPVNQIRGEIRSGQWT